MVQASALSGTMTALGTGGWLPTQARQTSCYLFRVANRILIFDAGSGFGRLTVQPDILEGATDLTIVLSHFHLDHVEGLGMINDFGIPVTVGGPGQALYRLSTHDVLERLLSQPFKTSNPLRDASVVDLFEGENDVNGWPVSCRAQFMHTMPSMGFRLGDEFAYLTDTEYDEGSIDFVDGVRWLLHEAWGVGTAERGHTSGFDAGRIARDAQVGSLFLTHLNPTTSDLRVLSDARRSFSHASIATDEQVMFSVNVEA